MRHQGHLYALGFLFLGVIQGVSMVGQVPFSSPSNNEQAWFFGLAAERLTMRLRSRVFRHVLGMHIGFFDSPSHSTGKIVTRLASDAPTVKSVCFLLLHYLKAGNRLPTRCSVQRNGLSCSWARNRILFRLGDGALGCGSISSRWSGTSLRTAISRERQQRCCQGNGEFGQGLSSLKR